MKSSEKDLARASAWYWENREYALARQKITNALPAVKERQAEYSKRRRSEKADQIKLTFDAWYAINKAHVVERAKRWKKENPLRAQFNRYVERAKKKGLQFDFTRDEFTSLIQLPCVYCGFPNPFGADRIASDKGYTKLNTIPCCKVCNLMKLDHSLEDFLVHIKSIEYHLGI